MALYLEGKSSEVTDVMIHRALRFGTINFKLVPVICGSAFKNKGVQMMIDAVVNYLPSPVDIPPVKGIGRQQEGPPGDRAQGVGRRALQRARLQDPQRPARQPHLLPRLLGQGRERHDGEQLDARQARAHRPHPAHAREQARRGARGRRGEHLRGGRPARHAHGRHALRREAPHPARADDLPGPGHLDRHRAEDQGRRREARRGPAEARRGGPVASACTPTRSRGRPSSAEWASCTSRSSSTGSSASSRSSRTSASPRSPTARPSPRRWSASTSTRSSPAVAASTATSSWTSSRRSAAWASSSRTTSSAA